MSRGLRSVLAVAALLAALAAIPPAALGAGKIEIEKATAEFPQRAYTLRVPEGLSAARVTVRENGGPVSDVRLEQAGEAEAGAFGTVLAIDASNSMRGRPIAEAMRAAQAFANRRAPSHELGLIAFHNETTILLPLTAEAREIRRALSQEPPLAGGTRIYDAVVRALAMLRDGGVEAGSVVVLSDGADTGSAARLPDVTAAARDAGVRIYSVAVRSQWFNPSPLRELAVGGSFADAAGLRALTPIFKRFSAELAGEYLLRYRSDAPPGESVAVEVQVAGVRGVARSFYQAPSRREAAAPPEPQGFWGTSAALVAAMGLVAALLGLALFLLARPQQTSPGARLARFIGSSDAPGTGSSRRPLTLRSLLRPLEARLERTAWWPRFSEDVAIAEIEITPLHILVATAIGTVLAILFIAQVLGAAILAPLGLLVPFAVRWWINRRLRRRRHEFAEQLADNIQVLASAMRAGQSMAGALASVVAEAPEPTRSEFTRIVNDERLGVPLEDAIRDVARRMESRDMEQVALVAVIQRETGGNTAEVLDRVIEMIRERAGLRRLMETLTAQGRLSQIVISAIPLVLLITIAVLNRDYLEPLLDRTSGHILLGVAVVLSIVGSLLIKQIVEFRE